MTRTRQPERPIDRLLSKLFDAELDDAEQDCLAELLERDGEARQLYHEQIALHAMLHWVDSEPLRQSSGRSAPVAVAPPPAPVLGFLGSAVHGTMSYASQGWPLAYTVATVIFAVLLTIGHLIPVSTSVELAGTAPLLAKSRPGARPTTVARITGALDCKWIAGGPGAGVGASLETGRQIGLDAGLLEITYDTGAKVILQGPVTYEVESAAGGYLSIGKLTARMEKGSGFRVQGSEIPHPLSFIPNPLFSVRTPVATIADLGTEFGVEVDKDGATKSYVFVGAVRVEPTDADSGTQDRGVILRARDSTLIKRVVAGGAVKPVVHHELAEADRFVGPDQFAKAARDRSHQRLNRRQARGEQICRDPALVAYYDFQRRPESPRMLHGVGPGADGTLDGVIQGELAPNSAALLSTEANILRGKPAVVSSTYVDANVVEHNYPAVHLTDSTEIPHVFADGDNRQRLAIHGFKSPVSLIRIWRSEDRVAQQVTIKSSLSDLSSLHAADYGTTLARLSSLSFNDGYVDIAVSAPAGTRSLFFDFGNRTEYYPAGGWPQSAGVRTMEIQAFATPPRFAAPAPPPVWTRGRLPGTTALVLDNAGVRINLPRRLTQMTLAAWLTIAFIDDKYPTCGLLTSEGAGDAGGSPEKLLWRIGRTGEIYFGTTADSFTTPPVLPWQTWDRNRWRHLAVVADPDHQRIAFYLDGRQVHTERLSEHFAGAFGAAGIGTWQSEHGRIEHGFHGRVDGLMILARAMTDQEIASLYETGKP